jgi:uncharacterized protein
MSLSMCDASVPVFLRLLGNLSAILHKAAAQAERRKIDPAVLLATRLYPDMFPLLRQVQLATDFTQGPAARLAGVEVRKFPGIETSIAEL